MGEQIDGQEAHRLYKRCYCMSLESSAHSFLDLTNPRLSIQSFAKKDLPQTHRVVKQGDMTTMDHNPDRLVSVAYLKSRCYS